MSTDLCIKKSFYAGFGIHIYLSNRVTKLIDDHNKKKAYSSGLLTSDKKKNPTPTTTKSHITRKDQSQITPLSASSNRNQTFTQSKNIPNIICTKQQTAVPVQYDFLCEALRHSSRSMRPCLGKLEKSYVNKVYIQFENCNQAKSEYLCITVIRSNRLEL